MVPAPVSEASRSHHVDRGHEGRACFVRFGALAFATGLLLHALTTSPAAAGDDGDEPIRWKSAFVVGGAQSAAGDRTAPRATTEPLSVEAGEIVQLHAVVEGERGGLPVYCTSGPRFRIRGRAIPERLIITPAEAGLTDAEIHWVELRPTPGGDGWIQRRLSEGRMRWSLPVVSFGSGDRGGAKTQYGTGRFAVAVDVSAEGAAPTVLGSSGWDRSPAWRNPEEAPGFRVTRYGGQGLAHRALGLARIPVVPDAGGAHFRAKMAMRPVDLVLGAYEELGGAPLPTPRDEPIPGPAWTWLFETRYEAVRRRTAPGAPVVGPDSRGVPWAEDAQSPGVRPDDVLVLDGDGFAILLGDDQDGWLGEADAVVHATTGQVTTGSLSDVPGKVLAILRARDLVPVRSRLVRAGYGPAGTSSAFDPALFRACRAFQHDQGLPVTGIPDPPTRAALTTFLERMRSYDDAAVDAAP